MKKINALLLVLFLLPLSLSAWDFGFVVEQNAGIGAVGSEDTAGDYEVNFIPRFSTLLGDSGEFVINLGMTLGYDEEFYWFPELLRTELSWRFTTTKLIIGRMEYADPFAYIAEGLFDGLQFLINSSSGTFYAGAWYTGLLFKENANITMTGEDATNYNADIDTDDLVSTYFASRRMVAAVGWEHPAIAQLFRTSLALIEQIDLNDRDNKLHSQYITAKIGLPVNSFVFELGGALAFMETTGSGSIDAGWAMDLGVFWTLPTELRSQLSFNASFFSGATDSGSSAAFIPITTKPLGTILEAKPSGIAALNLGYLIRLHDTLSANVTSTYFIRTDKETYAGYPIAIKDDDGYALGNEFYAGLVWSPFSDLQINFGGGLFIPSMGNVASDGDPWWRIQLGAVLSVY